MRTTLPRIEERIRSLVRSDYDAITHPELPERQLPPQLAFFRIAELARFWDDPQTGGESLVARQQRLVTSLHGIRCPWTYVILGEGGIASVLMGIPCRDGESRSWEQRLTAQLPGSSWRVDRSTERILTTLATFPMVAVMSGNPSICTSDGQQSDLGRHSPGLEALFETMAGVHWAYMVVARPLTEQEVTDDLRHTESEILEINSAYRRGGSAEESNNPLVTRYVDLLESAHQKLLQGARHGMWDVQSYLMTDTAADCERGAQALYATFSGADSGPQPLRIKAGSRSGMRDAGTCMTTRLNTPEAAALASIPCREVAGLQVTEYVGFGMASSAGGQGDIALGTLMSGGSRTSLWFDVSKDSLCKHMFVAGVPGSGKTRTCLYLLSQLWGEQHIPWLVLEPSMKSEYRALLRSSIGPDLRVFTAGDETVAPLRLNPLEVPEGVHVQTHIGGLTTLFKAAFAMEAPIPYVLEDAIHRVYEDRGWDLVSGIHPASGPNIHPTLSDLLETCDKVVADLAYEERVKANIRGALKTRLTSLMRGAKGRMLNVRQSISMKDLLSAPTVIEFSTIGDDDEKAFLLGCILLKLAQYRQTVGLSSDGLRHVTLIEEAHRLLRNVPDSSGTAAANPRRQAVEAFSNMLAELRAYGEGLVVVDQMPSKLVPDVIRNSGLKIVHRLTAEEERTIVAGAMSLNEAQTRFLSSLPAGQAIVYSDGSVNACRVSIPDHAGCEGYLQEGVSHADVKAHMQHRLPQDVGQSDNFTSVTASAASNLSKCRGACPAVNCATWKAVDEYAAKNASESERAFQNAMENGFDALWQLGKRVTMALWPAGGQRSDGPFCVVMALAVRRGMADRDIQVLRRNMARLRASQIQGGRS